MGVATTITTEWLVGYCWRWRCETSKSQWAVLPSLLRCSGSVQFVTLHWKLFSSARHTSTGDMKDLTA